MPNCFKISIPNISPVTKAGISSCHPLIGLGNDEAPEPPTCCSGTWFHHIGRVSPGLLNSQDLPVHFLFNDFYIGIAECGGEHASLSQPQFVGEMTGCVEEVGGPANLTSDGEYILTIVLTMTDCNLGGFLASLRLTNLLAEDLPFQPSRVLQSPPTCGVRPRNCSLHGREEHARSDAL